MVDALRVSIGDAQFLTSARVLSIRAGRRYEIQMRDGAVEADGVIVTSPAFETAGIIESVSPRAAEIVGGIDYASVALVTLVYPHAAGAFPPGTSGLLVPSAQKRALSAATWYSIKWPDAQPDGGGVVVRCFAGRARRDPALDLDDDSLVQRLVSDLDDALGLGIDVRESRVVRWPNGMPQYTVGHLSRVDEADAVLERDAPGVLLAGAGYRGSGIPDCIAGAHRAVERLRKIEASVG
jgi:oxygen-dependent protoporphyrinogen oxidase